MRIFYVASQMSVDVLSPLATGPFGRVHIGALLRSGLPPPKAS